MLGIYRPLIDEWTGNCRITMDDWKDPSGPKHIPIRSNYPTRYMYVSIHLTEVVYKNCAYWKLIISEYSTKGGVHKKRTHIFGDFWLMRARLQKCLRTPFEKNPSPLACVRLLWMPPNILSIDLQNIGHNYGWKNCFWEAQGQGSIAKKEGSKCIYFLSF